jgi:hypothetical protein
LISSSVYDLRGCKLNLGKEFASKTTAGVYASMTWPDEFVRKSPKMSPNPFVSKLMHKVFNVKVAK